MKHLFTKVIAFLVLLAAIFAVNDANATKRKSIQDEEYSVIMIGDTHWEAADEQTYHHGYKELVSGSKKWKSKHKAIVSYGKMWEDRMPRLVKNAVSHADESTKFVLQSGDIIEGYTENPEAHKKMIGDAYNYLKGMVGKLPFVAVIGNHDIRGNSGEASAEAYREFMTEKMSENLGKKIEKTTFSFRVGPDVFIVIDFNAPDNAEIEKLLKESEDARYTFLIVHGPVMPYDNVKHYNWFLHGKGSDTQTRLHFRSLFAKRHVIVLCGHTHMTEFAQWKGDGGVITQLTMSSVWAKESYAQYQVDTEHPSGYGKKRLEALEKKGKMSTADATALFKEYGKGLKKYFHSPTVGSYKMHVSNKGVTVDFYPGDQSDIAKRFVLK